MKKFVFIFLLFIFAFPAAAQSKYKIVYNVLEDKATDNYEIYSMNSDGTNRKNITNHKDVAWAYYAWKGKIFFVSDRDACRRCYFLYSMDADGNNLKKITDLQLEDSFMGSRNDGKELVVAARIGKEPRYQLFIVDVETGKYNKITNEPDAAFRDPVFSPDGKKIAYVYKKNRTDRKEGEELYIMNADGTGAQKLTTYPADDKSADDGSYKVGPPRWNTKKNFITYQSNQKGKSSIFAVTPDGKKQWKLNENGLFEGWHDWSPDGKWLALDVAEPTGEYAIYLINYKKKTFKKLTDASVFKYQQAPIFVEIK